MCLQSTFAATIRAIVTTNWHLTIPAASVTRYAPVFPLPQCFPSIASKPEQARCSHAILQSARVLQKLIRLGGKKEPRNPPASAQQPRPPVPRLSPEAQEVRFPTAQPILAKPPARLLACANAAARITSPFARTTPAQPPKVRSPALLSSLKPLLKRKP